MCNPQSQLIGDVCLQIYFVSDGFRQQWAVTPPVKTTDLDTVTFNFLATPNASGPTPASGCHYRRTIATQVVVVQVSMWSGLMASSELSSTKSSEQYLSFFIYKFKKKGKNCFHCCTNREAAAQQTENTYRRSQANQ